MESYLEMLYELEINQSVTPETLQLRANLAACLGELGVISERNPLLPDNRGIASYVDEHGIAIYRLSAIIGEQVVGEILTRLVDQEWHIDTPLSSEQPEDEIGQAPTLRSRTSQVDSNRPWSAKEKRAKEKLIGPEKRKVRNKFRRVGARGKGRYSDNK